MMTDNAGSSVLRQNSLRNSFEQGYRGENYSYGRSRICQSASCVGHRFMDRWGRDGHPCAVSSHGAIEVGGRANGVFWPYRKPLRSPGALHHAYCRLERLLYGAYSQRMEPLYRAALLVDACHGPGVADLYLDAVRGGTLGAAQTGREKHSARP